MSDSATSLVSTPDAELLTRFLSNDSLAGEELLRRLRPRVDRQLGSKNIPFDYGLAKDQRAEVLGWGLATYAAKASDVAAFDPAQGTLTTYLRPFLRRAARDVQAQYTPPGERTRPGTAAEGGAIKRHHARSLHEQVEVGDEQIPLIDSVVADAEGALISPDASVTGDAWATVDDRLDAENLIAQAFRTDQDVANALTRVYAGGETLTDVARRLGVHPSTLRRKIDRWVVQQGLHP